MCTCDSGLKEKNPGANAGRREHLCMAVCFVCIYIYSYIADDVCEKMYVYVRVCGWHMDEHRI